MQHEELRNNEHSIREENAHVGIRYVLQTNVTFSVKWNIISTKWTCIFVLSRIITLLFQTDTKYDRRENNPRGERGVVHGKHAVSSFLLHKAVQTIVC